LLRYWQKAAGSQEVSRVAPATSEARCPGRRLRPGGSPCIGRTSAVRPTWRGS